MEGESGFKDEVGCGVLEREKDEELIPERNVAGLSMGRLVVLVRDEETMEGVGVGNGNKWRDVGEEVGVEKDVMCLELDEIGELARFSFFSIYS